MEVRTREYEGEEPVAYVLSENVHRRHLTDSQKAAVAQDSLPWLEKEAKERQKALAGTRSGPGQKQGKEKIPEPAKGQSRDKAAAMLGVNARYVSDAKKIKEKAPGLFEQVKSGEKTIADAKREIKKAEHAEKVEEAKAGKQGRLAPEGPFDLILADPPWKYEHCEANNREIENHYETATVKDLSEHAPDSVADSILFMWATAPKLDEALQLMKNWGFNYRSCAVWDKEKIGMGYWWRIQHELLLVGVKGNPGCTPECERVSSVFRETRGQHSRKPECVYEWIERAFPGLKKLEMYCRTPRLGWAVWGNEV